MAACVTAVLFLDIDGVLNPFRSRNPLKWSRQYRKTSIPIPGSVMRPWTSVEHGVRLQALPIDVVWATTWVWYPTELEVYAEASGFPFGLPRISFTPDDHEYSLRVNAGCGKLRGVQEWIKANGLPDRFVWCDDLLGSEDREWTASLPVPTLLIRPDQAVGLRPVDFEQIRSFVS